MIDQDTLFYSALDLFTEQGTKFTMDELAAHLGISKRTLYENIRSKEELSIFVVERYFEISEERQKPIREDKKTGPVEKVRRLLTTTPAMPLVRLRMNAFKLEYPKAYALLDEKLTTGWEKTFQVMDEGIASGKIKDFDKALFASIYAAGIERIITDCKYADNATFCEMQSRFVDMLLFGITEK